RLRAADAAVSMGIEVETDKKRVWCPVGDVGSLFKSHIFVASAGKIDTDSFSHEKFLNPFGKIEGEVFLDKTEAGRPGISPAVARVEDNSGEIPGALERCCPKKSREEDDGDEGE